MYQLYDEPKLDIIIDKIRYARITKNDFLERILFLYSQLKNSKIEIKVIKPKIIKIFWKDFKKAIISKSLKEMTGKL